MELEEFLPKLVNDFMHGMWEVVFYENFLVIVDCLLLVLPRL